MLATRRQGSLSLLAGAGALGAALALAAPAAAASKPTLTVVGQPPATGAAITGEAWAQTGLPVALSVTLHGSLKAGETLQLRTKASADAPFVASHVAVHLHGDHATLHVTVTPAQDVVSLNHSYEIVVLSHGRIAATSQAVAILWDPAPPTIMVQDGAGEDQAATTSTTTNATTCSDFTATGNACTDTTASPGEMFYEAGAVAPNPPPGWKVELLFNNQVLCTNDTITGMCSGQFTYPASATAGQSYPLTAELISPQGKTTTATINLTYPGGS